VPEHHDDALVAELRALGAWLDVPEPADQRTAIRSRLSRRHPARRHARRWIVAAVAALVGTVTVVAPARAAVVDAVGGLLRVAGIEVRRAPPPGSLPSRPAPLPSIRTAGLDQARAAALFPVRVPASLGTPEQVVLADPDANGAPRVVTMTYRDGAVRFDQFDGRLDPAFLKSAPDARWTEIGASTAIWLPGPHPVTYVDRDGVERTGTARLAAPTLIWATDAVTYRLEGFTTLEEAREAALSLE
jgi:hypothetical protein